MPGGNMPNGKPPCGGGMPAPTMPGGNPGIIGGMLGRADMLAGAPEWRFFVQCLDKWR